MKPCVRCPQWIGHMAIVQVHYGSDDDGENRNYRKCILEVFAEIVHTERRLKSEVKRDLYLKIKYVYNSKVGRTFGNPAISTHIWNNRTLTNIGAKNSNPKGIHRLVSNIIPSTICTVPTA